MLVLFTDFGLEGPYVGQMKAVLHRAAPGVPVIDLFADAPCFDPLASAHLLAAYSPEFPPGSVFLCVVDPGVGSERRAVVLEADGRCFVGPDNGLMDVVAARAGRAAWREIVRRPDRLSASFHGRDLFAPVAAALAAGRVGQGWLAPLDRAVDPASGADLARVVYVDRYGNAMTGLRAASLPATAKLAVGGRELARARTFADVTGGGAMWYMNANGLAEIAVNGGRADKTLGLDVGTVVEIR